MNLRKLYINCDLGEGFSNDFDLIPLVNQVNIACGGHAGSPKTMKKIIKAASEQGCAVGAHPGYRDREYFGRRPIRLTDSELKDQLSRQLDDFGEALLQSQAVWHHIKPHGALYHDISRDKRIASLFLEVMLDYPVRQLFLTRSSWAAKEAIGLGIRVWEEAFLDRNYDTDGQLVPRTHSKALITDKKEVKDQFWMLLQKNKAQTFCIHGDQPHSPEILTYLHQYFPSWGLDLIRNE